MNFCKRINLTFKPNYKKPQKPNKQKTTTNKQETTNVNLLIQFVLNSANDK